VSKSLNAVEAIIEARRILQDPEAVYELRGLGVRTGNGRAPVTASGYFDDIRLMAEEAAKLNQRGAESIHATMNPVRSDLLARAVNRLVYSPKHTSKDDEIVCRRQLLVDLDPVRPPGVSSTDEEHKAALERARQIRQWLMEERNWPAPVMADSGNGGHLAWRIELPNDNAAKELVRAVLQVLAQRFDDDKVNVDCNTFNASRISKIYGTMARKGDDTEERPHRRAQLLDVPGEWTPVSREQLEQLASEAPRTEAKHGGQRDATELRELLTKWALQIKSEEPYQDGAYKFVLAVCPFDATHNRGEAVVIRYPDGGTHFKCHHQGCKGKNWAALCQLLGLEAARKKKTDAGQPSKIVIADLPDVRQIAAAEPTFLIPGLVVSGDVNVMSGEASAGKTTLCMDLGRKIATGAEAFGGQCEQHPVLYMTRENGVNFIADITRRLNIDNGPNSNFHIWGDWCEEPASVPGAAHVLAWVSTCKPAPFIIIDSLIAFFDGKDENSAVDMRAFLNQGRLLLRAGACGVLYIAHPGKVDKMLRGSSDLKPAIDAGYFVSNSGDGKLEKLYLKAFKTRFLAQKSELVLDYQAGGFAVDERPAAVYETVTERLTKLLAERAGSTKTAFEDGAQAKGLTRRDARRFLDKGVLNKWILCEKGPRNAKYYSLVVTANPGGADD
jgi:hypothetical protein